MDNSFFMSAPTKDTLFIRIATSNDYLVVFAIILIIFDEKFKIKIRPYVKYSILFTMLIVLFLTFTRYIWALTILVFLFNLIISRSILNLITYSVISTIIYMFVTFDIINIDSDFSRLIIRSADTKLVQTILLYDQFSDHPFLGTGIGSYIKDYTRNSTNPYLYENQLVSIFMQFGIIGGLLFICFFIFPIHFLLCRHNNFLKFRFVHLFVLLYFAFLFSSLTNPNLFLLNFSLLYFLVYLLIRKLSFKYQFR